jgi:hypothetical protein
MLYSLLGNCVGKEGKKSFSLWSVLGSSQRPMDGLDGDHVVPLWRHATIEGLFSARDYVLGIKTLKQRRFLFARANSGWTIGRSFHQVPEASFTKNKNIKHLQIPTLTDWAEMSSFSLMLSGGRGGIKLCEYSLPFLSPWINIDHFSWLKNCINIYSTKNQLVTCRLRFKTGSYTKTK